ncbi:hypothetical protein P3L10_026461 [Capsicum annuum]
MGGERIYSISDEPKRFRGTGPRVSLADQWQSAAVALTKLVGDLSHQLHSSVRLEAFQTDCTGTDISKGLACGPSGSQAPFDISGWDLGALHVSFPLVAKSSKLFSNKQDVYFWLLTDTTLRYVKSHFQRWYHARSSSNNNTSICYDT